MSEDQEQLQLQRHQRTTMLASHVGVRLDNLFDHVLAAKESYTREHSQQVVALAEAIGTRMGLDTYQMQILSLAAGFHDLGKIGVSDDILLKPGCLSDQEYEAVKEHPVIGSNMLRSLGHPLLDEVADSVLYHHERWDGQGYPKGLACDEIPLLSRIVSVVDAFDAMTTTRSYRQPLEKTNALKMFANQSGIQFDPGAVTALFTVLAES
ncbi:MAG: HD-GYP domain-containing protein [Candidatus Thiodiazotropha sp.]|jgi:HD-GYP domain-containing protein (c-di-GMP phosphodiesterase class II)